MISGRSHRLFRIAPATAACAGLLLAAALVGPVTAHAADSTPYDSVDMWIGTAKDNSQNKANDAYGNTWPGATVPFGMVQYTPTTTAYTNTDGKNEYSVDGGYMTSDSDIYIRGFGMTRLSGTGCNDRFSGFDIPFLPYTGTVADDGTTAQSPGASGQVLRDTFLSRFTHSDETSSPGYYKVALDTDGGPSASDNSGAKDTTVELTATTRTGAAKISFPSGKDAAVLFNVSGSNNSNGLSQVTVDPATRTISGFATAKTVCNEGSYRIFFSTTFDQPFTAVAQWQGATVSSLGTASAQTVQSTVTTTTSDSKNGRNATGVILKFADGAAVESRTGISYVSDTNAALNRTTEAPASSQPGGRTFEDLRSAAKTTWVNALGTVDATGGTTAERTKFYTALYHSLLHPNVYEDVNGQYRGYYKDSKTRNDWPTSGDTIKTLASGQEHEYVTYSSWDSLRGQMQLVALLFPKVGSDMAASIYNMSKQVGTWYNWPHLGSAQKKMEGDGMQSIVASLYAFGSTDFDAAGALSSMVDATSLGQDSYFRSNFVQYAGTGFIEDRWTPATSTTMDYSVADFGIAQLAGRLGQDDVAARYMTRSQSWKSLVSQDSAYPNRIVPRDRKGFWGSFTLSNRSNSSGAPDSNAQSRDQFDQSTGLQYQWYMTQNMASVIEALGGTAAAESKLDSLFGGFPSLSTLDVSGSSSNGAYLSNQPSMHAPWVYNWLGKPAKTTQVLDKAISTLYCAQVVDTTCANANFSGSTGVGLPGNDDLGSLSSWYVWANLGLYPAIFGRSELLVSSPHFDKVVITSKGLDGSAAASGRTITLNAANQSANRYISGLSVNGTSQTRSWLPESFAVDGGTLDFTMTSSTTSSWGTAAADVPPSFNQGSNDYNGVGTGVTGTKNAGSLDVGGVTFPREALANVSVGATPGAKLTYDGVTFTWPASAPLQPDHWVPRGQSIDMHGVKASKLSFLGTATNGPASGTARVVYSDGTTTDVPVTFPDWTPSTWSDTATNQQRISATGRLKADGTLDSTTWRIYSLTPANLDADKNIAKVILPSDVKTGIMHIFSIGTDTTASQTPAVTIPNGSTAGGGTVTLTGGGVNDGDKVTVTLGTTPTTSVEVTAGSDGSFTASLAVPGVAAGSYPVTVTVTDPASGQTYTLATTGSVTVAYAPAVTAASSVQAGKPLAFTGTGFAPAESVVVSLGTSTTTVTASASGTITGTISAPLSIAGFTLTATGSVSETAATRAVSVTSPYEPGNPKPTVTIGTSRTASIFGQKITLTARVSLGATGKVSFIDGTTLLGTATISRGVATLTTTALPAGTHAVTAAYLGSASHLASTSGRVTVKVSRATTAKVTVSAKKYLRGKKAKVKVSVKKLSNGSYPTGVIRVYVGKKKAATVRISAGKKGKITVTVPKRYTKKKSIKVKAVYVPTDTKNVAGKTSKAKKVKAKASKRK